ncbi:MAG TPA: hypothetical protein VFA52_02195 [Candidatus Paceibacterota bacterium]|nr:hypothetical protein [Candidatus Paceibacterota bacterium]
MNIDKITTLANLTYTELKTATWNGKAVPMPVNGKGTMLRQTFRSVMVKWSEANEMPLQMALSHPFITKTAIEWASYTASSDQGNGHAPNIAAPPLEAPKDQAPTPVIEVDTHSQYYSNRHSVDRIRDTAKRAFEEANPQTGAHTKLTGYGLRQVSFVNPMVEGDTATNTGRIPSDLLLNITATSGHLVLHGQVYFTGPTDGIRRGSTVTGITGSTAGLAADADGNGIDTSSLGCIPEIEELTKPMIETYIRGIEMLRTGDEATGQAHLAEAERTLERLKPEIRKFQVDVSGLFAAPANPSAEWQEKLKQRQINLGRCPWVLVNTETRGIRLRTTVPAALTFSEFRNLVGRVLDHIVEEELAKTVVRRERVLSYDERQALREELKHSFRKGAKKVLERYPDRLTISEVLVEVFYPNISPTKILDAQFVQHRPEPPKVREDEVGRIFVGNKLVFDPIAEVPSPLSTTKTYVVEKNHHGFVVDIKEESVESPPITYGRRKKRQKPTVNPPALKPPEHQIEIAEEPEESKGERRDSSQRAQPPNRLRKIKDFLGARN